MIIRELTPDDAPAYRDLRQLSLEVDADSFGETAVEWAEKSLTSIQKQLVNQQHPTRSFVLGAFDGDDLIGMAGFKQRDWAKLRHKGLVWGIFVHPDYRGQGIGGRLLDEIIAQARQTDVSHLLLAVLVANATAVALYQSRGFQIFATEPAAMRDGNRDLPQHRMMLELRPHSSVLTPQSFIRADIAAMEPYTPIVPFEVLSERVGRTPEEIVKLDANENPYGPSPKALEALRNGRFFHIYPDPESSQLRRALSEYVGVPADRLMAGAGADELIDVLLRVVVEPGDGVIDCPPSFGMYPFSTAVNSGRYIPVRRQADFSLDVAGIETAVARHPHAKVLFLCSPNNPDGSLISDDDLRRLLQLPLLVVLDEAYVDFAIDLKRKEREERKENKNSALSASSAVNPSSRISWVMEYDNLAVLRTFSKLAGLAGLRVGYGAFPAWLLPQMWKIKQPYNINVAANIAALASLADQEYLHDKLKAIVEERGRMVVQLAQFDWLQPYPSHSNFVLFRVNGRSAHDLKLALEQEGVFVRYFNKPGLDNCIRITAGRPADTDRLVTALQKIASVAEKLTSRCSD